MKLNDIMRKIGIGTCILLIVLFVINYYTKCINPKLTASTTVVCLLLSITALIVILSSRKKK